MTTQAHFHKFLDDIAHLPEHVKLPNANFAQETLERMHEKAKELGEEALEKWEKVVKPRILSLHEKKNTTFTPDIKK